MTPLIPKSDFVGLEKIAHLCTGGEAPWLRSHDQASARMGALKSAGMAGRHQLFAVYERAKSRAARMLGWCRRAWPSSLMPPRDSTRR